MEKEVINTPVVTELGNNNITTFNEAGSMVNATQMAKPSGKKPADWLRLNAKDCSANWEK